MKKLYEESSIQEIADAIRSKNGSTDTYTVAEMAAAIQALSSGGVIEGYFPKIPSSWISGTTDDVKYLTSVPTGKSLNVTCSGSGVTVNWGDGATSTISSAGSQVTHGYSSQNYYEISCSYALGFLHGTSYNYYIYAVLNNDKAYDDYSNSWLYMGGPIAVYNEGSSKHMSGWPIYSHWSTLVIIISKTSTIISLDNQYNIINKIIYVPDALVDSYKTSTNWAAVADNIYPLSQCPFIE